MWHFCGAARDRFEQGVELARRRGRRMKVQAAHHRLFWEIVSQVFVA
jgi:hypothetical protein